jgi:preprotein translocase subunit SecG
MVIVFLILIVIIAVVLGFLVLIQAPKGGGLASNLGTVGNNLMGVKQTTDVLEKGTWIFVAALALLCLFSSFFVGKIEKGGGAVKQPTQNSAPANTPTPTTPTP